MTAPNEIIVHRLLQQAEWCEKLGSRLYSTLLRQVAVDVRSAGVCCAVLHDHRDEPPELGLALRFLGGVHRLVLEGKAPQLAACYPSAGGDGDCDDVWGRFQAVVQQHEPVLRDLVLRRLQTNEVGRCAALLGGFLEIASLTGLPLRLLEVGAAAGLILRWDQYRYQAGCEGWGNRNSPARISCVFGDAYPCFDAVPKVVDRRGCDASPIDPCTEEGEVTLKSFVWPDQVERFCLLSAAINVARLIPAHIEKANAADWIEAKLAHGVSGVATVVYHSAVWQYLSNVERTRFKDVMAAAGLAATHENPLAWLRFEPASDVAEVRLQLWPGGKDRLLARSGFHGKPVQWIGCET